MTDMYSLTVTNKSQMVQPTFAVFAVLPEFMSATSLNLAWLTQPINKGNTYRFSWNMTWEFVWSAEGVKAGHQWNGSGSLEADAGSKEHCRATFDYDRRDWALLPALGQPDLQTLTIADTTRIPPPSEKPSSVGLSLNGKPVCAIDAGPDLEQVFTLHPTYYISAGTYVAGQMVTVASLTKVKELEYTAGNRALSVTLNEANKWEVQRSSTVNFGALAAANA